MQKIICAFALLFLLFTGCRSTPSTETTSSQAAATDNSPMQVKLPLGIDAPAPVPADNPITPAKVELGRQLFFDARLSADGSVSCATCHNPVMGYTDGRPTSMGVKGQLGGRSAPSIINLAYANKGVFWDGRAESLEEQA